MRVIRTEGHPERHAYRLARRRAVGCRVYLRVALHEFLMSPFHRPTGCPHWHYVLNLGKRP